MSAVLGTLVRRIGGTGALVLLLALGKLGMDAAAAPPAGSYEVEAMLGRAGSGLNVGTDVKVRGVRVGSVSGLRYEDGQAIATLLLEPEPRLPAADDLELVVTAKTLLGEKQIEIGFPDARFGEPPFLQAGDAVVADRPPTELQEVLDVLEPFFDAIDPQDLATIVDVLAAQRPEADRFGRNLELGEELAAFGARTADEQLARLRSLERIVDALSTTADDFNRMNRSLPEATSLIADRRGDVRRNLDALSRFSVGLAEYLEVEDEALVALARSSQPLGRVVEANIDQIGLIVHGMYRYFGSFGHGGDLDDRTEFAYFRIFLGGEHEDQSYAERLCEQAGVLGPLLPACQIAAGATATGDRPVQDGGAP